jgi:hypothetical protein
MTQDLPSGEDRRATKQLWILATPTSTRNFESVLRLLAARGHELVLAVEGEDTRIPGSVPFGAQLAAEAPNVSYVAAPPPEHDAWWPLRRAVAGALDAIRFREPHSRDMPFVARQAAWRLTPAVRPILALGADPRLRRPVRRALRTIERALPVSPGAAALLAEHEPDVVLMTPFLDFGTPQARWVRAARERGVASCICVYSWDALALRGQIRERPDLLTVWNEAQRRDAVEIHELPDEVVAVTGAQAYDHWFQWEPATTREEFCARVGLPPDRPFLLYLGSSGGYVKEELPYVREWVQRLRSSGRPELEDVGVLVRPHPKTKEPWSELDGGPERTRVWPRPRVERGASVQLSDYNVSAPAARREYYDSIFHSAGVVGINTSALVESAIVGRPVLTLLEDRWRYAQEETRHFRQLADTGGGVLRLARTFDEHADQLAEVVRGDWRGEAAQREYVRSFVRPFGLDEPATPRFAATIEALALREDIPRETPPAWLALLRPPLLALSYLLRLFPESEADLKRYKERGRKRARHVDRHTRGPAVKRVRRLHRRSRKRARVVAASAAARLGQGR